MSEQDLLDALAFGHGYIRELIRIQRELIEEAGRPKVEIAPGTIDPALTSAVEELAIERIITANRTG